MTKKTITKMAIGTSIGALAGAIAYRLIKDHRETKEIKTILDDDEFEEEINTENDFLTHEDMTYYRTYTKLR